MQVSVKALPHADGLSLPAYATDGSAGLDLRAAIEKDLIIEPFERVLIPTGLIFQIPLGYEGQIRPRSGLSLKYGITIPNSPGTIDSDYRGEVKVILLNLGKNPFTITRGDRIAQLVFSKVERITLFKVNDLDNTNRSDGGFGSTGK